ncbi:hypothetical protein F2Q69_00037196 [Brassica cretica]|nr:hypothetical protein F2Q69_00037196 [Brassica cretica]
MIKLKHLKTSRTIHGLPLELWYIHSHLNAPRHGYLRETDTDILEKLTGTQIPLLIESFWVWASRVGFSGAASKLGYRSPKAGTLLVTFWLGMRDIALPSHRKKEYEVVDNIQGKQITGMFTALPSLSLTSTWLGMRHIALPSHRKKEYEVSVRLQLANPSPDVPVGETPVESSNNVVAAVHQYLNLPDIESLRN